jgi:hypothetical protein
MNHAYRTELPTLDTVTNYLLEILSAKAPSVEITLETPCAEMLPIIEEAAPSIEEKFVLKRFDVANRLSTNAFRGKLERAEQIFYRRFPENCLSMPGCKIKNLAALIHLLCQVAWRTDQSRFTLTELNERYNGLGSQVYKLITGSFDTKSSYRRVRNNASKISELLGRHKIDASDVLIDKGRGLGLPLHVSISLASAKHET